ncbi:LptF/LptG family permease [Mucilaginibacter arboris]|uniref:LptF/LptG family permease n=1 Tax=Mucilaginibacter arboris TaxID=2682090 RepID=A0A7K1SZ21_9SPHI|nr:LptF/LptG family permease [Mucilaginibacter arboris]MVN22290.1 LptF/LptG family permease [Mucilaginibacter arboris]
MQKLTKRYLKIIDWYIINKYLGTFVFTLGIFLVIIVVFDISEKLDDFLKHDLGFWFIVTHYYFGFIPFYLNFLSPLINFIAVIFFTAKMADQTEIVPILSGGASFNRFLRPYAVASSIIFIVSLVFNVFIIPHTNQLKSSFENTYVSSGNNELKNEVHMQLDKSTYVYVQSFDEAQHTGYQFVLEKFKQDTLKEKIMATRVVYDSLKRVWSMMDYSIRYVNGLKEKMVSGVKKDTLLDMHPADFVGHNAYDAMPMKELNTNIEKEKIRGTGIMVDLLYEKYQRFVYPLSSYILTLIGVSMSSRKVRGGIGLPLGIGIFLCFAYIVTVQFAKVFALKGGLPPIIAVFIPNIIFGILGGYLLRNAPK